MIFKKTPWCGNSGTKNIGNKQEHTKNFLINLKYNGFQKLLLIEMEILVKFLTKVTLSNRKVSHFTPGYFDCPLGQTLYLGSIIRS